jgi:aminoglycoside phosphotransferase (APT) family kinase protein
MIPPDKQAAVSRALQAAFGTDSYEDIRPLTGGLSAALVFRIVVRGTPYLLRVIVPWAGVTDPTRQFKILEIAAPSGLAPAIRYMSVEDRILITDFVTPQPFPDDMAARLAPLLHRLHGLPGFPRMQGLPGAPKPGNYFEWVDGLIQRFQAAKLLPEELTAELFRAHTEIGRLYPRNAEEYVACHNDLKPQNMVFDGTRLWLVDWEAGFLNDRYADLAMAANFFVRSDAEEAAYLETYFGEPPGAYRRARFFLVGQAMHLAYAMFLLPLAARAGTAIAPDLETGEERVQYAKVHLNAALGKLRSPRFTESLALLSQGGPG